MSGIAGIFYRNNKPLQLEQLQAMGTALAHRGPDGINYYCKDSVGFVHCMLHDTPESLLETLPNKTEDENFVITFHGRIDNRQELYDKIGWIKPLSAVTDSDLVLAAYRKWRKECVDYLLGDFAFAVWDQIEGNMFCARDHMGVKPFYYYLCETLFAFASEIKGLLVLSEIPRILNEERVADYISNVVLNKKSTFHKDIFRLLPGHFLEIYKKRSLLGNYHEFRQMTLHCKNNVEYEEQFREIFSDAVRVRLRSSFPVGSYLSGGLDSASIVCVAAGLFAKESSGQFHTFSGIYDKIHECDERKYFSPVIERYELKSHTLLVEEINPAIAYEKLIHDEDEPFWAPHVFMIMGLMPMAKESGVRVLLDGHDGDAAISYGYNLFVEMALTGRISQLVDCYRKSGVNSTKALIRRLLLLHWNIFCNKIPTALPFSPRRRSALRLLNKLNPHFFYKIKVKNRLLLASKALPYFGQEEKAYHLRNITQPIHSYALEFLERIAGKQGIITRYPFFDRRVIEFCLALPVEQKMKNGFNRNIVRRAFADVLPESISKRREKTDFTRSLLHGFRENDLGWLLDSFDIVDQSNYAYFNKAYYKSAYSGYVDGSGKDRQAHLVDLLGLVTFSKWIETFQRQ